MDVHVFYFHEEKQQVVRSYIGSHFLAHTNGKETFQSIQAVHGKLDLTHNLVQVPMDGQNLNWKAVEIIKAQSEQPLAVFLYEKLKELLTSITGRFICPAVLAANSSTQKMWKINLKKEGNLISSDNINLGIIGTTRAISKCTETQPLETRKFKQYTQKFLILLVEKLKERSPLRYYYTHIMSFTKPDSFFQRQISD